MNNRAAVSVAKTTALLAGLLGATSLFACSSSPASDGAGAGSSEIRKGGSFPEYEGPADRVYDPPPPPPPAPIATVIKIPAPPGSDTLAPSYNCEIEAPTSYQIHLRTGSCQDIAGVGGVWHPTKVFAKATGVPQNVRESFCQYDWVPSSPGCAVGKLSDATRALADYVSDGFNGGSCADSGGCAATTAAVTPLAVPPDSGGSSCSICAIVLNDWVYVTFPPEYGQIPSEYVLKQGNQAAATLVLSSMGANAYYAPLPTSAARGAFAHGQKLSMEGFAISAK